MNAGILAAITAGFLNSFIPLLLRKQGDVPEERAGYQLMMIAGELVFPALMLLWMPWETGNGIFIACSLISGAGLILNSIGLYYAARMGPLAIAWIVAVLASPAVALLWLVYPGTEKWTLPHVLGMLFFLGCLLCMWLASARSGRSPKALPVPVKMGFFAMVVISLVGGIIMLYATKCAFSHPAVQKGSIPFFLVVSQAVAFSGVGSFYLKNNTRFVFTLRHFWYAALAGVIMTAVFFLILWGVDKAAAARFFTANAASLIICTVLLSWRFEGEKPALETVAGAILAAAAIACVAGK